MKIKADKDFKDRKTKKLITAGTVVEADEKRLSLLDAHKIKYEIIEKPSLLDGNVEQVKKAVTSELNEEELLELLAKEQKGSNRKGVINHIESLLGDD